MIAIKFSVLSINQKDVQEMRPSQRSSAIFYRKSARSNQICSTCLVTVIQFYSKMWYCHSSDTVTLNDTVTVLTLSQFWHCHSSETVTVLTLSQFWNCHSSDTVTVLTLCHRSRLKSKWSLLECHFLVLNFTQRALHT